MPESEQKAVDLKFFWRVFKRFWLLIAVLGIAGGCIGYGLARWVVKPTYQATALIFAWSEAAQEPNTEAADAARSGNRSNSGQQQNDAQLAQEMSMAKLRSYQLLTAQLTVGNLLMPDFQTLLNSRKLKVSINRALKEKLGDRFSADYKLSAQPLNRTRFVEISVRCHNRELAPTIINEAMAIFTQEARELLGINNTQVIDKAQEAVRVAPRPVLYTLAGLCLGLLLGGGIGFAADFLDKSIRDLKELENRLHMPILGVLPEVPPETGNDGELWQQDTKSVYGEAIRSLRVNIEYLLPETGSAKIFLTTSVNKGDGKSSVISSLAVAVAKIEKKVLLVDVDLRRPRQHRIFKLSNKAGLVDLLVSKKSFDDLVHRNVKLPGLDILTSGTIPITPSDLLGSRRLEDFLKEQSQHYDYIFLDAPPTLGIADPMILGKLADSTILVCDCKQANVDKLRAVTERLRQANVRLGGLVINRFLLQNKSDYYYYYQHYYYGYHYSYMPEADTDEEIASIPETAASTGGQSDPPAAKA